MSNEESTDLVPVELEGEEEVTPTKSKGGRPKGKRDVVKRASPFIKAQAKGLYITGFNIDEISKTLQCSDRTIAEWAKQENWAIEREKQMGLTTAAVMQDIMRSQQESLTGLRTIGQKALDAINGKLVDDAGKKINELNPKKFAEASNAYIAVLEAQYRVKSDSLQASFIYDLSQVLRNKIQDKELLKSIAEGLHEVFVKYQKNSLATFKQEKVEDAP